jgi:hypothetical protein
MVPAEPLKKPGFAVRAPRPRRSRAMIANPRESSMSNVTSSRAPWGARNLATRAPAVESAGGVVVFAVLAFVLALLAIVVTLAPRNPPAGAGADVAAMFGP